MNEKTIQATLAAAFGTFQSGRLEESQSLCRQILQAQPTHPEALHLLGVLHLQSGDNANAIDCLTQAARASPMEANYRNTLGEALRRAGRFSDAIAEFRAALEREPAMAEAAANMGLALQALERSEDALAAYRRAIELAPRFADAWCFLGCLLNLRGRPQEALPYLRRATELNPGSAPAWYAAGMALSATGQSKQALAAFQRTAELAPHDAECWHNIAFHQMMSNRFSAAKEAWQKAITLNPDYAVAHFHLAMALLLEGDYAEGWRQHEWRWQCPTLEKKRHAAHPQWTGDSLDGRTLLLHSEQGLGDTLQFLRFIPLLAARGATVIVECQWELADLARSVSGVAKVIAQGDALPRFDCQLPMLSLPHVLGITLSTIPAEVPYLAARLQNVSRWHSLVERSAAAPGGNPPFKNPLRVGLVWQGRSTHVNDKNRSIALTEFAPLAAVPNVQLFSLQKGAASDPVRSIPPDFPLTDLTAHLTNFADTAALISQLDLVISVDTSVAHLAGALAKPVWTQIPFTPDWRWLMDRTDSPWYPTMRLFRQKQPGDWASVIKEVAQALRNFRPK